MSDADKNEPKELKPAEEAQEHKSVPRSGYEVVPYAGEADQEELFAYRSAMAPLEPKPNEQASKRKPSATSKIAVAIISLAIAIEVAFAVSLLVKQQPPAPYIDMGTQRFDSAGLSGRLIARWQGSATYQLFLDPLDPADVAGFQAVAEDPPQPISIVIRLRDASGIVICQRQILLPVPPPATDAEPAPPLLPQKTPSGDTVQNMAGADGKIREIIAEGPLPCPLKAYRRLAGWDFLSNFPALADQKDWLQHEDSLSAARKRRAAGNQWPSAQFVHLTAPIEGDDVIVGDNPSRGILETSTGRVFFIGAGVRNRGREWQIFPAAIHFRCEKNGFCVLTRLSSGASLQARLAK